MRGSQFVAAPGICVVAVLAQVAFADDELAEARRLEAALDYAGALALVDRALAHGGADPGRLVELHVLAGRLAAGLDRAELARGHFARALALRPELALPAGTSPKLTAPFEAARARSVPLRLHATSAHGLVTLQLDADPLGLVAGIRVHVVDAAGAHAEVSERAATRIVIPTGTTAIEIAALDAQGNQVWLGAAPAEVALGAGGVTGGVTGGLTGGTGAAPQPPRPHLLARWSTWAITTGVVAGAAGFAAWRFRSAQHDWDELAATGTADYAELAAVEDRGRRWGLAANLGLGVATLTGLSAIVLYLRAPSPARRGSLLVGPGPTLGISGQF